MSILTLSLLSLEGLELFLTVCICVYVCDLFLSSLLEYELMLDFLITVVRSRLSKFFFKVECNIGETGERGVGASGLSSTDLYLVFSC